MSEYISIRDDLYKKLDTMRIEKENGKKTSFSDAIQEILDENKLLYDKNKKLLEETYDLEEKNKKLRIDM